MSNNPFAAPPPDQFNNPYQPPTGPLSAPIQPMVGAYPLATRFERFAGAFIDGLILMVPILPLAIAVGVALVLSGMDPDGFVFKLVSSVVSIVLNGAAFLAINGYLLSTRGQTVGKLAMKTQIVSLEGRQVPLADLVTKRYLPQWVAAAIPMIGPFILLVNALMIFRENRHCLHDDIAGTNVIKLPS